MPLVDKSQKIDADQWLFHKPLLPRRRPPKDSHAPNLTKWNSKIGLLRAQPYKEIVDSDIPPAVARTTKQHVSQKGPVYTRFTKSQHRRRENVERVMDMVDTPKLRQKDLINSIPSNMYKELFSTIREGVISSISTTESALKGSGNTDKSDVFGIERGERTSTKFKKSTMQNVEDMLHSTHNPYIFWAKKVREKNIGLKRKGKGQDKDEIEHPWGTPEEHHMKQVVQEYCEWVFDLGGDHDNIDESTMISLFAGGYDTKPNFSMPVHVVRKNELPPELVDENSGDTPSMRRSSVVFGAKNQPKAVQKSKFKPFRYGAWYLKPKSWTKMAKDEQLEDPKALEERAHSESDRLQTHLNEELSRLYISSAFTEYLKARNGRLPQFLVEVAKIQERQKEQEKLQEEAASMRSRESR